MGCGAFPDIKHSRIKELKMKAYIDALVDKWGTMKHLGHYCANGDMPFISAAARLNIVFDPEKKDMIDAVFQSQFNCEASDALKAFYAESNGCRLFSGSLNVWGIQLHPEDLFEPFDLMLENQRVMAKIKLPRMEIERYYFFASLGGEYIFGIKKDENSRVYGFKSGSKDIAIQFDGFDDFFDHFFSKLLDEYDLTGRKKHPNIEYQGIPVLENVTYKLL